MRALLTDIPGIRSNMPGNLLGGLGKITRQKTKTKFEYADINFPCSADQEQDRQRYPVDPCMYGHTYIKSMDQPGKVANSARGQLKRKNEYFPVRVRA